ncbi:WxcM-like domain-containing protein [Alphaproteobacteria bacterium]|nr:WxcM-like domain-containing protein [Alphaproteobacteria bacterium]
MDGIALTPLLQIHNPKGDIYQVMKKNDLGYHGFGEAYFSSINKGQIKNWKKHTKMTLNLIVAMGEIKFVVYDDSSKNFFSVKLSKKNYQRLTVKPGLWLAFQGLENTNMLLNLANIEHDPSESVSIALEELNYEW